MRGLVAVLVLVGLAFRVAPLLDHGGRLLRQFPTEDGYLMLTIARNLALGLGMSTAAGTIPTNGTQPGMTFVYALGFWLAGGDKSNGVFVAQIIQIAFGMLAAWLLYRLGRLVFARSPDGRTIAALAAATWFAAPLCVQHSQNCLETGAYIASVLAVVLAFLGGLRQPAAPWSMRRCLALGALCGLAFWMRNDASLLILACCLTLAGIGIVHGPSLTRRLAEAFTIGATSIIVALPWLIHNKIHFGNIVPISGQSEAAFTPFAANAPRLLWGIAEYVLLIGGIPGSLESRPVVLAGCVLLLAAAVIVVAFIALRARLATRTLILLAAIYASGLCVFYGLFFGAGYFMSRYMFPLSPFLALLWAAIVYGICTAPASARRLPVTVAVWAPVLAVIIGLNARAYLKGDNQGHFQVVEWVQANVPADAWVGAPQTGTLGFFHDRTINLDGKVNPEALEARLRDAVPQYVLDREIAYLADWVGLAGWAEIPVLKPHFELLVEDHERNLAVLGRRPTTVGLNGHLRGVTHR